MELLKLTSTCARTRRMTPSSMSRSTPAREVVDDSVKVRLGIIDKSDGGDVDVPVLVGVRCSDARLGLFRVHTATWSAPTPLPDELRPNRRRSKDLIGSLGIHRESPNGHVAILRCRHHAFDRAHLDGGELRRMRAWAARPIIELAVYVGSLPSVVAGLREAHQAQRRLQGKGAFAAVDRTQNSGLGLAIWKTLLIEAESGEL